MAQPIPKRIKQNNPDLARKPFYTLLVDGSNLLELSSLGDTHLSGNGKHIGGIFQFFLQLKILLQKGSFRYIYVFWDSESSGQLRYELYPEYKANRDKSFDEAEDLSDYMKEVNARVKSMKQYFMSKRDPAKVEEKKRQKKIFFWQRDVIMQCLEELFIRQCMADYTEADDFIGYYVSHKKPEELIYIMSNDVDISQLVQDKVAVYVQSKKKFLTMKTYRNIMGYDYRNVVLKKMICGDNSDNIKGIKMVGEKTLLDNFPEIKEREVSLQEVIDKAKKINEDRAKLKKKPLMWAKNIVERVTDGSQGDKIYEINRKIIDLKNPLMTDEAKQIMEELMYAPIDPEGRSMENLYKILVENDVDDFKDPSKFANFFTEFAYVAEKERKNSEV